MQQNCPDACYKKTARPPQTRRIADDAFYDLTAKDAHGKVVSMENFEGYVTVIVNGARVCGKIAFSLSYITTMVHTHFYADHSELFYETLEHMHSINPYTLEILAFPFDHPNITTAACADELRALEKRKGRKIHVMKPIEINGPNTHPVFKYMKDLFGIEEMELDFSHYFFVNPDGNLVELHFGASYNALKSFIDMHVREDLRDEREWEL